MILLSSSQRSNKCLKGVLGDAMTTLILRPPGSLKLNKYGSANN